MDHLDFWLRAIKAMILANQLPSANCAAWCGWKKENISNFSRLTNP
jgi:hypothetical protein